MIGAVWTEEEIWRAAQLWAERRSPAEIAALIGRSKNAVAGLAQRRTDLFPRRARTFVEAFGRQPRAYGEVCHAG